MQILIMIHSLWRWLVLATALLAILGSRVAPGNGAGGWTGRTGLIYTIALDIQVLIGLIIWVANSGWTAHPFYAYVHPVLMLVALGVAHMGRGRQKRAVSRRRAAGFWAFTASLLLVILGIPWFD